MAQQKKTYKIIGKFERWRAHVFESFKFSLRSFAIIESKVIASLKIQCYSTVLVLVQIYLKDLLGYVIILYEEYPGPGVRHIRGV